MKTRSIILWLMLALWVVLQGTAYGAGANAADAAQRKDKEALRVLVKQHADVNAAQPDGTTALHWASHRDDVESADLLIRAGARVNATNDLGVTPLWSASLNGSACAAVAGTSQVTTYAASESGASLTSGAFTYLGTAVCGCQVSGNFTIALEIPWSPVTANLSSSACIAPPPHKNCAS